MGFVGESIVVLFLDKLIQLLKERAELLIGVKHEVKLLLDDLGMISAFLEDSEAERYESGAATKLEVINQMREVAYEVEHVIDKYTYHFIMQKRRNMLGKSTHYLFDLGGIGNTIMDIKRRIDGLHNNKGRYRVEVQPAADRPVVVDRSNSTATTIERDDAVGLAGHTDTWVQQLTDGNNLEQREVLIVGMGGLGKSKLSNKVFQESECPENLKDTGMELAANCQGLPLSIIVLGKELLKVRLMGAKHSFDTWRSYERHVYSHLIRTKTLCFNVLVESYLNLPPELKFCFLYLSLFPEDFVISVRQLTELNLVCRGIDPRQCVLQGCD